MERTFWNSFKQNSTQKRPKIFENEEDLSITTEPTSSGEVHQAVKNMKSGKSRVVDEINAKELGQKYAIHSVKVSTTSVKMKRRLTSGKLALIQTSSSKEI